MVEIAHLESEIKNMLQDKKEVNAWIRVEQLIREERLIEAYTVLDTFVDLVQTRAEMLKKVKEVPMDMYQAILTILFATERVKYDVKEMHDIASLLQSRFKKHLVQNHGKRFFDEIKEESIACSLGVNANLIAFLSVMPATSQQKMARLKSLSIAHAVPLDESAFDVDVNPGPGAGYSTSRVATRPSIVPPASSQFQIVPLADIDASHERGSSISWNRIGPSAAPEAKPAAKPKAKAAPKPKSPVIVDTSKQNASPDRAYSLRTSSAGRGWRALSPTPQDLGYTFGDKLNAATTFIYHKHQSSGSSGSERPRGPKNPSMTPIDDHASSGFESSNMGGQTSDLPRSHESVAASEASLPKESEASGSGGAVGVDERGADPSSNNEILEVARPTVPQTLPSCEDPTRGEEIDTRLPSVVPALDALKSVDDDGDAEFDRCYDAEEEIENQSIQQSVSEASSANGTQRQKTLEELLTELRA